MHRLKRSTLIDPGYQVKTVYPHPVFRRVVTAAFTLSALLLWLPSVVLAVAWVTSWQTLWRYQGRAPGTGGLALRAMIVSGHLHVWELNAFDRYAPGGTITVPPSAYPMAITYSSLRDDPAGVSIIRYRTGMTRQDWFDTVWFHGSVRVPIWIPTLAAVLPAAAWSGLLMHRRRKRIRLNLCLACGYPISGRPAGEPCPECGLKSRGQ